MTRVIHNPTQLQVLDATGGYTTHLGHHQELQVRHFGEDGPQLVLVTNRTFTVQGQINAQCTDLQDWALDELFSEFV